MNQDYSAALTHMNNYFFSNQRPSSAMTDPAAVGQALQQRFPGPSLQPCFPANPPAPVAASATPSARGTTEAAVSEALLTLSSVALQQGRQQQTSNQSYTSPALAPPAFAAQQHSQHHQPSIMSAQAAVGYATPAVGVTPAAGHERWQLQALPTAAVLETPQQTKTVRRVSVTSAGTMIPTSNHALYHPKPVFADDAAVHAAKKARTVSPPPAPAAGRVSPNALLCNPVADMSSVSCICPVCDRQIKGLGDHQVDWSQPVQGRQRAKTITSIKKHVKDFHENEPIWNVIVNSIDVTPSGKSSSSSNSSTSSAQQQQQSRVVTAQAFVTQALKKAALDQIPNTKDELRCFRWTEKMLDQRVGIAKGFIQFGGQEYLRNKECQDDDGLKINPKSLRILAYCLLQSMYDNLYQAWNRNQPSIEAAMAVAPLGLLRNRFQLLFAAPDKWDESWYMDPTEYSNHNGC